MTGAPSEPGAGAPVQPSLFTLPAGDEAGPSCPVHPKRDVRLRRADCSQIGWGRVDVDAELPAGQPARAITEILLGLWVYATSDGVGSAGRSPGSCSSTPRTAGSAAASTSPITGSMTSAASKGRSSTSW